MKKNKSLIIILLIVVVGLIGLTLAYFTNTASLSNEFKSKEYGTTVTEEFTSPENWLPGSTEPKTLTVTNSGQVDEAVRVSYVETWTSKNGDNLSLTQNNNRAAIINFNDNGDWAPVTENNKTYYYYNYKLQPNGTTSTLLNSVTFNKDIVNTNNCVETKTETGKKVECSSSGDEYDGATYRLVFTVETVQYDKYTSAWNTNKTIASMKPMNASALALRSNPITVTNYTDGNIHEMYTFEHEETEQTPALTDYRYIGNDPYNYIYFNCDDLNNQTAETCEVWRIIGVFDVDDGTGNYQKRIKLVRGSAFFNTKEWDEYNNGLQSNNWPDATLNIFLNGNYFNKENDAESYGLKELAQNQIAVAKYYLGGRTWQTVTNYGSTEDMYKWERGMTEYDNTRATYWIGNIGLMYPSDYAYSYYWV